MTSLAQLKDELLADPEVKAEYDRLGMISKVTDELTAVAPEGGELLGYTVEELRELVKEGLERGPNSLLSMEEIKAEARRRFEIKR
jgi:hypothetical protein